MFGSSKASGSVASNNSKTIGNASTSDSKAGLSGINVIEQAVDVGDLMPPIALDSQVGRVDLHDLIDGKWLLLVTFNKAFDPVATTDIGMLSRMEMEFESRNIQVVVVGNDTLPNYRKWIKDIEELQAVRVNVPLLADKDNLATLRALGAAKFFPTEEVVKCTTNATFLVDLDKRVRYTTRYPTTMGRNWYEVLRTFDALSLTMHQKVVCPSNWGQGQDVLLSEDITKDEATLFRFTEIKSWFRLAPCPE